MSLYAPLNRWQTRVLKLLGGSDDEPLRGDLLVANLVDLEGGIVLRDEDKFVEYDALSYTWGASRSVQWHH